LKISNEEIKKIIGELDEYRLQKDLIQAGYGPVPVVIGDLFAVGCYFIHLGKKTLGHKLCQTALAAYDIDITLMNRIIERVESNEEEMANLLNPHCEIPGWLFDDED
jgi:hypothetical protein